MENYKILIIEDDHRQVAWAKECLKKYNLTFLTSFEEYQQFSKTEKEQMHLVITDLFLPQKSGEMSTKILGTLIFFEQLEQLQYKRYYKFTEPRSHMAQQNIFGLALLSNYEHHIHSNFNFLFLGEYNQDQIKLYTEFEKLKNQTKKSGITHILERFNFSNVLKGAINVFAIYDESMYSYQYILSPDMKVISREKFREDIEYDKDVNDENNHKKYVEAFKTGGYLCLKPYAEVVEFLITNRD